MPVKANKIFNYQNVISYYIDFKKHSNFMYIFIIVMNTISNIVVPILETMTSIKNIK